MESCGPCHTQVCPPVTPTTIEFSPGESISFNDLVFLHIRYRGSYHILSGLSRLDQEGPDAAILFQMKHPKNVSWRWQVLVKFTGKSDMFFSGPKLSCPLRDTRKSFRELYGTVFGPEKFSGLLKNARQLSQSTHLSSDSTAPL